MNPFGHAAELALNWLWQTTIAASTLILIALAIQLIAGRFLTPRWTYALWCLVAARLVLPFAPESRLSIFNLRPTPPRLEPEALPPPPAMEPAPMPIVTAPLPSPSVVNSTALISALWLAGALGWLLCCLIQYRRFALWIRRQPSVSEPALLETLHRAQTMLGYHRPIRVVATQTLPAPSVFGLTRPVLLLPRQMLETWNPHELELVFLHELVHVRRRDNLLNWILIAVLALHWFNPLVWFALRRLRAEREALCDALVLSILNPEARADYGATLIRTAEFAAPCRFTPTVVPIINHKHQLRRRIRMITRFKPTPRTVSVCATVLLLAIACVTFTGAAQKQKSPEPVKAEGSDVKTARDDRTPAGIRHLEEELQKINAQIDARHDELQSLQQELEIPTEIAEGRDSGFDAGKLRKLEELRIETEADYYQTEALREHLLRMKEDERRRSMTTATPNEQLSTLLHQLAAAEQKLAVLNEDYAPEHPEVRAAKRLAKIISNQIDDRIDGILVGLNAKANALKAKIDHLKKELEKLKFAEIDKRVRYRPYFQARRDIESLSVVRDRLIDRIIQEKIDHAIPPNPRQQSNGSDAAPKAP